ncbi:MAG: hypothetical protein IKN81_06710 [Oscillospiraceae bacterium]|nr:hypothetical protein [Oscillospiraceae bacterium]
MNEEKRDLLPLDLELTPESLDSWLRHRTIPKNRANVHAILSKCSLNLNRPMSIINVCKGLSLNDSYWVVEEGFSGTFSDYSLYDNRFCNILALIAFTGYGSSLRSSLRSSPEFSTNGMLPKCWRRVDGKNAYGQLRPRKGAKAPGLSLQAPQSIQFAAGAVENDRKASTKESQKAAGIVKRRQQDFRISEGPRASLISHLRSTAPTRRG